MFDVSVLPSDPREPLIFKELLPTNFELESLALIIMITFPYLALWSVITLCPVGRTLTLNLYNVTSPGSASQNSNDLAVGVDADTHCTQDPNWLIPAFPSIPAYDNQCQVAMLKAVRDLTSYGLDTEFELLNRGAIPKTPMPKVLLPRKYVASEYCSFTASDQRVPATKTLMDSPAPRASESHRPSCTVAIAMINSLESGGSLPGLPPGPFGSSDITTMTEILYNPGYLGKTFLQCLRVPTVYPNSQGPSLGWTQAGEWHSFPFLRAFESSSTLINRPVKQSCVFG